jgi:hypothetical protein
MENSKFYFIKNEKTMEVWSGYKWKKGTWQKAMLYERADTVYSKVAELNNNGYACVVCIMEVSIEERT